MYTEFNQKLIHLKWKLTDLLKFPKKNYCIVCGKKVYKWIDKKIITDDLAKEWNLSNIERNQFDLRESHFCPYCRNSARTRFLAEIIIAKSFFNKSKNLEDWVKKCNQQNDFKVAEINSCGNLHPFFTKLKELVYTEYPKEDIMKLSYPNNSFDLILHSEVLEHVKDPQKAISECRRILNKDGICLFTIPIIPGRKTIKKNIPSYHGSDKREDYLVLWEFGDDFIDKYNLKLYDFDKTTLIYVLGFRK
jgi:hypothetical protein